MQQTWQWLTLVLALQLGALGIWGGVTMSQQHVILQALRGDMPGLDIPRFPWGGIGLGEGRTNGAQTGAETPAAPAQQGEAA